MMCLMHGKSGFQLLNWRVTIYIYTGILYKGMYEKKTDKKHSIPMRNLCKYCIFIVKL